MSSAHPDFLSAAEADRWTGDLPALFYALSQAAYRQHGLWVRKVLPRGAWVMMRVKPDDFPRKELCIARREAPQGPEAEAAWARELAIFCRHAARHPEGGWYPTEDRREKGAVKQYYAEVYPGEVRPGFIRCLGAGAECGEVLPFELDGPKRCSACQRKHDVEEVKAQIGRITERAAPYGGKA